MSRWLDRLARLENRLDRFKYALGARLGADRPLQLMVYMGYGTRTWITLSGRVLEDQGIRPATEADGPWDNLLNMYRRFASDEVPGARVRIQVEGEVVEQVADAEGYFRLAWDLSRPLPGDREWYPVEVTLLAPRTEPPVQATGQVLVPPSTARFGVISDVDDTILHTDATSLRRMVRTVVLANARTRRSFPGTAAFYRALHRGRSGDEHNPIFYVSSSPWNLYDLLVDFLEVQGFPLGPLLLRDWGLEPGVEGLRRHAAYKQATIRPILDRYPHLGFLLIGDSGQEDAAIYADLVAAYPDRILAVYIRDVTPGDPGAQARLEAAARQVADHGVPFVAFRHVVEALHHAAAHGWIRRAGRNRMR